MDWSSRIRLRSLQMLVRLCDVRNMSQVAQEYHLTQPALSKWLKELEDSMGAELFARHARGVTPTPVAEELARQARAIVGRIDRARLTVQQMKQAQAGQVAVGVSPMVAIVLLPEIVRAFHADHPGVFIRIDEETLDLLTSKLHTGGLDVIIGRVEEGGVPPGVCYRKLDDVPLCLAVAPSHPLAGRREVSWDEALEYPWIAPAAASPIRRRLRLAFEALGLKVPPVMVESASVFTSARIVQGTDFVVPMSARLAASLGLSHTLNVPWFQLGMHGSIGVMWRPEDQDVPLIQSFVACVCRQSASLR
ncbi:LysR family transcriptional regulator [Allopusillimonas soli]|uniref:LysR family transcriptional regulator n=1 Tax=Allopusillimonas soli TaxID=659016 RepID=A0A853FB22_9BURK|nr:LysR family transcriptional regulator [Allopusillimonas soli]NYT37945.1 LysR family transcriptional regulator [Allopusillimonas soli]TEA73843.1 LysR family transcriptional regulator [Allopusillimonas soli]